MAATAPRVVVVFNKWWELDPALAVLTSAYLTDPVANPLGLPVLNDHPRLRRNPPQPIAAGLAQPRAVFALPCAKVEIWCVSDLLEHLPDAPSYQSSSERKAERLPLIFPGAALCIAVGTAASGEQQSRNGSVVIGTRCFLHNGKPNGANGDSNWQKGPFDQVIGSSLSREEFATVTALEDARAPAASLRLLPSVLAPAPPSLVIDYDAVAVGCMNVTSYQDYDRTDRETLDAFAGAQTGAPLGSLETTHGLIRVLGIDRFIFVSGVVDRLLHFKDDVGPRPYAQNTVGAHNAGVALAWMLPRLAHLFRSDAPVRRA